MSKRRGMEKCLSWWKVESKSLKARESFVQQAESMFYSSDDVLI